MSKEICQKALKYTRPIIIGKKYYKRSEIINEIATLIVINKNGDILTTKENAEKFIYASEINETYQEILKELKITKPTKINKIEKKYGLNEENITHMIIQIIDVASTITNLEIILHKYLNIAVIKNSNDSLLIKDYPKFYKGKYYQGENIIGLGYAFPEYENFYFDKEENKIITTQKRMNFPAFPVEGIITRNILDEQNNLSGFEINSEIYTGMNGGPILNKKGEVLGIMSSNKTIMENNTPVIKLGIIINSEQIIKFLEENNIEYNI